MKKIIPIFLLCILLLCGCRKDYDRNDIKQYVKTEYGLRDVSIEKEAEQVEDENGSMDYIWTVNDQKHNLKFRVLDDFQADSLFPGNGLRNDYEDVRLAKAFENYNAKNISLDRIIQDSLCRAVVTGTYGSRQELQALFEETNTFLKEQLDNEMKVSVHFSMENPYRNNVDGYEVNDGDYRNTATEFTDEMYQEAEENSCCPRWIIDWIVIWIVLKKKR